MRGIDDPAFAPKQPLRPLEALPVGTELYLHDQATSWADAEVEGFKWRGVEFGVDLGRLPNREPQQTTVLALGAMGVGAKETGELLCLPEPLVEALRRGVASAFPMPQAQRRAFGHTVQWCFELDLMKRQSDSIPPGTPFLPHELTIMQGVAFGLKNSEIARWARREHPNLHQARDARAFDRLVNDFRLAHEHLPNRRSLVLFGHATGALSKHLLRSGHGPAH